MLLDEELGSDVELSDEELGSDEEKSCAVSSFSIFPFPNCSLTRTIAVSNAPKISSATIAVCDPCRWNFWNGCTEFLSL